MNPSIEHPTEFDDGQELSDEALDRTEAKASWSRGCSACRHPDEDV